VFNFFVRDYPAFTDGLPAHRLAVPLVAAKEDRLAVLIRAGCHRLAAVATDDKAAKPEIV
jgi:hypothetical protein